MNRAARRRQASIHRRNGGRDLHVGREPLPALETRFAANRSRFKPGQFAEVVVEHDAHCRYPKGEPCTCVVGPEIHVRGERPEEN